MTSYMSDPISLRSWFGEESGSRQTDRCINMQTNAQKDKERDSTMKIERAREKTDRYEDRQRETDIHTNA